MNCNCLSVKNQIGGGVWEDGSVCGSDVPLDPLEVHAECIVLYDMNFIQCEVILFVLRFVFSVM